MVLRRGPGQRPAPAVARRRRRRGPRTATGWHVTARTLLRDLTLLVDKVDPAAVVDDMLATLLPGESVSWQVPSHADVDPEAFLHPTVLRSANQLVHGPTRRGRP